MPAPLVGAAAAAAARLVAKKLASKAVKKTVKKPALTAEEKFAVKFVKDLQKKGKPGDVRKVLDSMDSSSRAAISKALRKTVTTKQTTKVNTPTKRANPDAIKVRGINSGKLSKEFKTNK
jgi:polyhydroxyalkanoate synthesis regulator phasin